MKSHIRPALCVSLAVLFLALSAAPAGESAALTEWRRQAASGDAGAMNDIGVAYFNGSNGVARDYARALEWYRKAVAGGDALAATNLHVCYLNGYGVGENLAEAHRWAERAAEGGSPEGYWAVGFDYLNGYGVDVDYAEAEKWLLRAAEGGEARGYRHLGILFHNRYLSNDDPDTIRESARYTRLGAQMGDSIAQYNLGVYYENGMGVKEDPAEAANWWLKAAEQGNGQAQYHLGRYYLEGTGVKQDYALARRWLTAALENGEEMARDKLAEIPGGAADGAPQKKKTAPAATLAGKWTGKAWTSRSPRLADMVLDLRADGDSYVGAFTVENVEGEVEKGSVDSQGNAALEASARLDGRRFTIAIHGKPAGDRWEGELAIRDPDGKTVETNRFEVARGGLAVGPAEGESVKLWLARKGAAAGDPDAMLALGHLYFQGTEGLKADLPQALEWYKKAAEAGDATGAANAGAFYKGGMGVAQDYAEAFKWFLKAAELGDDTGQREAGYAYMLGRGVGKDFGAAEKWFMKAAEQGDSDAAMQVANIATLRWQEKKSDEALLQKSIEWYRRAAEMGHATAQLNLAVFYNNGQGVKKDFVEAGRWYERAARGGEAAAQFRLGVYYAEGKGREVDLGKAKRWFLEAQKNGDERAASALAQLPAEVEAVGDIPLRIAAEQLIRAFVSDPKAAEKKYRDALVDVTPAGGRTSVDLKGSTLILTVGDLPLKLKINVARKGGGVTVNVGNPVRGFCRGVVDGMIVIDDSRFITKEELGPEVAEGGGAGKTDGPSDETLSGWDILDDPGGGSEPAPARPAKTDGITGGGTVGKTEEPPSDTLSGWDLLDDAGGGGKPVSAPPAKTDGTTGGGISGRKPAGISGIGKQDPLAGLWVGTYRDDGGEYGLRIDKAAGVELVDEGLALDIAEAYLKDGLATVRAGWTADDGQRREAFFTGPVKGGTWEGTVVVTTGAEVFFQGPFTLKKTAKQGK